MRVYTCLHACAHMPPAREGGGERPLTRGIDGGVNEGESAAIVVFALLVEIEQRRVFEPWILTVKVRVTKGPLVTH